MLGVKRRKKKGKIKPSYSLIVHDTVPNGAGEKKGSEVKGKRKEEEKKRKEEKKATNG